MKNSTSGKLLVKVNEGKQKNKVITRYHVMPDKDLYEEEEMLLVIAGKHAKYGKKQD